MKYKLKKESLVGTIKDIMKENDIKKENIVIPLAAFGVVTIISAATIISSYKSANPSRQKEIEKVYDDTKIVREIDYNYFNQNSIIDFENYDVATIAKMDENYGSLYSENDVILYRNQYGDIVHDKALKWGIDENLLLAILTEESRQGGIVNLMQIEFDAWKDVPFKVYDFQNDKYVDILLTDNQEKYNDPAYLTISRADLTNPETNISIGAAIMQNSLYSMNYHVPAAIQCYNYGLTKMNNEVFKNMENTSFKTKNEVLNDQYDFTFMNNTVSGYGDANYFYDVLRFINPDLAEINVLKRTEDGNETVTFDIKKLLDNYHEYQENSLGNKI